MQTAIGKTEKLAAGIPLRYFADRCRYRFDHDSLIQFIFAEAINQITPAGCSQFSQCKAGNIHRFRGIDVFKDIIDMLHLIGRQQLTALSRPQTIEQTAFPAVIHMTVINHCLNIRIHFCLIVCIGI